VKRGRVRSSESRESDNRRVWISRNYVYDGRKFGGRRRKKGYYKAAEDTGAWTERKEPISGKKELPPCNAAKHAFFGGTPESANSIWVGGMREGKRGDERARETVSACPDGVSKISLELAWGTGLTLMGNALGGVIQTGGKS